MSGKLQEYEKAIDGLYEVGTIFVPVEAESVNPYDTIIDWVRIEILDIKAIMECIQRKDDIAMQRSRLEKQVLTLEAKIEKSKAGKSGIFSIGGNAGKIERMQQQVLVLNRDIEMTDVILRIIISRLNDYELPHFKTRKGDTYAIIMGRFAVLAKQQYSDVVNACKKTVEFIS
jgi:hypothetical protein